MVFLTRLVKFLSVALPVVNRYRKHRKNKQLQQQGQRA